MGEKYLSANTLFHFTNNIDNILNILKNEFSPRYCMENFKVIGRNVEIAIPMVCFCDIPLSQIRNHIENYGGYAIGLTKEWGVSKEINPVMYSTGESISTKTIDEILREIGKLEKSTAISGDVKNSISKNISLLNHFAFYIKPYEGQVWNKNEFNGPVKRFYDEREWRYIPAFNFLITNKIRWYLNKDEFLDDKLRDDANKNISEVSKLSFEPSDIKYIIVNSEDEILRLYKEIDNIKGHKYSSDEVNILRTRIISKEQILNDF